AVAPVVVILAARGIAAVVVVLAREGAAAAAVVVAGETAALVAVAPAAVVIAAAPVAVGMAAPVVVIAHKAAAFVPLGHVGISGHRGLLDCCGLRPGSAVALRIAALVLRLAARLPVAVVLLLGLLVPVAALAALLGRIVLAGLGLVAVLRVVLLLVGHGSSSFRDQAAASLRHAPEEPRRRGYVPAKSGRRRGPGQSGGRPPGRRC